MATENYIELHILEHITNGFSECSKIGRGGYGDVYKGVYDGREVAVKLLHVDTLRGLDDQQFKNEVCNLLKGGSLDKCLYGKSFAPNWTTRYNIIKGICEGLNFLHDRENPILHLDLKPANILLDSSMVPKVADFGLSRLFNGSHTRVTERIAGTKRYMPPESTIEGMISVKNDVFSFGVVMIDIMIGSLGHFNSGEIDNFTQLTQQAFRNCNLIEDKSLYREAELDQVNKCIGIATHCVHPERKSRPTMADILVTLNKTEIDIPKRRLEDFLHCPTIGPKSTMAKRLKVDPTANVENITNKQQHSDRMPRDISNINVQQGSDRETSSDVPRTLIIGRTEEKQKILLMFIESIAEEMVILPIYGIGGIGKTTLAQLVFNDPQLHEYSRVWVYVSQDFDLKKIANSIIEQLQDEITYIPNKQMQHNRLRKLFTGESILIVLDDLWEEGERKLSDLVTMLKLGTPRRLIVIVTTRDEAIARKVCGQGGTPYKLESLTNDMCCTIIKEKTAFENRNNKKHLEHIGLEIAAKCGGVALAAQSLGYMLSEMDNSDEWESMRDSYIWNLSTTEGT